MKIPIPDLFNYIYDLALDLKYIKYPCKKCLVKVQCLQMNKCEPYQDHLKFIKDWKNVKTEITDWFFVMCIFGGLAFICLTFVFGLYKWGEIGYKYFS